jgi:hypothetical protein
MAALSLGQIVHSWRMIPKVDAGRGQSVMTIRKKVITS